MIAGAIGVLLRFRQLLVDRSLWVDEALLVRNVLQRDLAGLLEPLDGQQGAPIGYLWTLRIVVDVFGGDDTWLRVPSLLFGSALLFVVWCIGVRLFSVKVGALAVALVAISPGLIRYSTEVKQYSLDALIVAALVLAGVTVTDRPTDRRLVSLAAGGDCSLVLPPVSLRARRGRWTSPVLRSS